MELFLNLLWALIAAGAVGVWRIFWLRQKVQERREPFREWTAMGCALVLLFFAISLTDDLHSEVMLSDECSTGRRHSICSHHPPQPNSVIRERGPATLSQPPKIDSPRPASIVVALVFYWSPNFSRDVSYGRAPPISIL